MSLGERIRKRREELELTQKDLTLALGVTPQHISVVEQDKRAPSLTSLARLARELGVTIDYLVTGQANVTSESIPTIKADSRLSLKSKRAIISLLEDLYLPGNKRK